MFNEISPNGTKILSQLLGNLLKTSLFIKNISSHRLIDMYGGAYQYNVKERKILAKTMI